MACCIPSLMRDGPIHATTHDSPTPRGSPRSRGEAPLRRAHCDTVTRFYGVSRRGESLRCTKVYRRVMNHHVCELSNSPKGVCFALFPSSRILYKSCRLIDSQTRLLRNILSYTRLLVTTRLCRQQDWAAHAESSPTSNAAALATLRFDR